jgi:hypothetical protein
MMKLMRTILQASGCSAWLAIFSVILFGVASSVQGNEVRMLVQSSPLAGFQYHAAREFWDQLKVGDRLTLVRERDNPHDVNAVRVDWHEHKLGYVPRRENRAVAHHMDRGGLVEARISKLAVHRNPWQRIEFEVSVKL